jgi:hypothetical protein
MVLRHATRPASGSLAVGKAVATAEKKRTSFWPANRVKAGGQPFCPFPSFSIVARESPAHFGSTYATCAGGTAAVLFLHHRPSEVQLYVRRYYDMDIEIKNKIDHIISQLNSLRIGHDPGTTQTSLMACLLVILAEEQEKAAVRMEQQTDRLVKQTDRLVRFTKGLYVLTAALLFVAAVQIAAMFFLRP